MPGRAFSGSKGIWASQTPLDDRGKTLPSPSGKPIRPGRVLGCACGPHHPGRIDLPRPLPRSPRDRPARARPKGRFLQVTPMMEGKGMPRTQNARRRRRRQTSGWVRNLTESRISLTDDKRRNGGPGASRTPDPQIRSLVLYPAELRVRRRAVIYRRRLGDARG